MKTEHRLAEALKELMSETSLDEISVLTLTKKCKINRQSFYYHFHDIFDLLTLVFLDERIENIDEVKTPDELIKTLYKYYANNEKFIDNTVSSAGKELFEQFIYNACYQTFLKIVDKKSINNKITLNDKKSIARYYGLATAYSYVYFLSTAQTKSYPKLRMCFDFLNPNFLDEAIKNVEKRSNK